MLNYYSLINLITSIIVILLGLIVFAKKKSKQNLLFFTFSVIISGWLFSYFLAYNSADQSKALFYFKTGYLFIILIPIVWFHFCVVFLRKNTRLVNYLTMSGYLVATVFIALLIDDLLIVSLGRYFWGFYPVVRIGTHLGFLGYFNFYFTYAILLLFFSFYRKPNINDSNRIASIKIKYMFWASLIGTFAAVDFMANYKLVVFPFGSAFMFSFVGIVFYAILKHRLLDVAVAITRSTIFISIYIFVLGIPFLIVKFLGPVLISYFGTNWWMIVLVCSTLLATAGPFLYLYVEKKAENRLFKEQKAYQNVLKGASSGMIRIKNLNRLLDLIVRVVAKTVKINHASIYLYNEEERCFLLQASRGAGIRVTSSADINIIDPGSPLVWMLSNSRDLIVSEEILMKLNDDSLNLSLIKLADQLKALRAALVVPSFIEKRLIGIFVLGEKRSGKMYSQDDLNVFSVLANQAALAIENAQFYDEIKNTHQQLFQAEKLATIGTMADGLSHQINNRFHALSLIAGDALDVLKTSNFTSCDDNAKANLADIKNALERIEANVMQGGEVVKGLLKYSRPGDGGFEMVDFQNVLNGAIDMVQFKIKLKEIDLVQSLPEDMPKVHANTIQLQEVFFNLIDNAYDATQERRVVLKEEGYRGKIEISASGTEDHLVVNIIDNGMGIKDVDKKKLFTPFFTTKATAKKGTGLGLYVIERIVAAHGGKIDIQSVHGQGTIFIISLPTRPKLVA